MIAARSIPALDVSEELGDLEFDPDDVLASLVPYEELPKDPEPEVPPPELGNEKAAKHYLSELDLTEAFEAIASRVGNELSSTSDPTLGADLALAVSEIRALTGEYENALSLARQAVDRHPSSRLARMQVRQLSVEAGDYQAIPTLIADELAILDDPESKAQLTLWHHEFFRLALNDTVGAYSVFTGADDEVASDAQVSFL